MGGRTIALGRINPYQQQGGQMGRVAGARASEGGTVTPRSYRACCIIEAHGAGGAVPASASGAPWTAPQIPSQAERERGEPGCAAVPRERAAR